MQGFTMSCAELIVIALIFVIVGLFKWWEYYQKYKLVEEQERLIREKELEEIEYFENIIDQGYCNVSLFDLLFSQNSKLTSTLDKIKNKGIAIHLNADINCVYNHSPLENCPSYCDANKTKHKWCLLLNYNDNDFGKLVINTTIDKLFKLIRNNKYYDGTVAYIHNKTCNVLDLMVMFLSDKIIIDKDATIIINYEIFKLMLDHYVSTLTYQDLKTLIDSKKYGIAKLCHSKNKEALTLRKSTVSQGITTLSQGLLQATTDPNSQKDEIITDPPVTKEEIPNNEATQKEGITNEVATQKEIIQDDACTLVKKHDKILNTKYKYSVHNTITITIKDLIDLGFNINP